MTPGQIQRVRKSFATIVLNLDQVSAAFCQYLLGLDPGRDAPFGGDPAVQRTKVGAALAGLAGSAGEIDRIRPALQALGRERARQGLGADDYAKVGEALIAALAQALGESFDAQTRRAWVAAYCEVAWTMIGAGQERIEARAA